MVKFQWLFVAAGLIGVTVPIWCEDISLEKYHSHETINEWLEYLHSEHPDMTEIITFPNGSYHHRTMKVIKIGKPSGTAKNAIWIDCGIHAREWISPATCLRIISELLTNTAAIMKYSAALDVYVLPVANPDGYEYSRRPGLKRRMWRKSRSKCRRWSDSCCGVDQNRNFGYKYGGLGASAFVCAEDFRGEDHSSEPEVKQVIAFVAARKQTLKAFLTLHSWGKAFLYPWGYMTKRYPQDNLRDLAAVAQAAAAASGSVAVDRGLTVYDERTGRYELQIYRAGSSADLFGPASGASDDWAQSIGIKYTYTIELSESCENRNVFFKMPERCIDQATKEAWTGIQVIFDRVKQEFR